jgi:hypothetical protein
MTLTMAIEKRLEREIAQVLEIMRHVRERLLLEQIALTAVGTTAPAAPVSIKCPF